MSKSSLGVFAMLLPLSTAFAQPDPVAPTSEKRLVEILRPFYLLQAQNYSFATTESPDEKFDFIKKPVMSWTGQERQGFTSGDVFVWVKNGRAQMIGCIGSTPSGDQRYNFHEFHSLAHAPLEGVELGNGAIWTPNVAGVKPKPAPGSADAAKSAPRRLLEMRRLARSYNARMESQTGMEQLRLLPQPVFRYDVEQLEKIDGDVVDGALFAFVWTVGTDPELLLLLECRKSDDKLIWQYAPVRFTYRELWLEHKDSEVWRVGRDTGNSDYDGPYVTVGTGVRSVPEIEAFLKENSTE